MIHLNFSGGGLDITPSDNSVRVRTIMGVHTLTLHYALPQHVEIPLGAWVEYQGLRYELKKPTNFKKKGRRNFEYTLILEDDSANLRKYKARNIVDGRLKFSLAATPKEHLKLVVDNMNKRESGWAVGDCLVATEKTISYNFTSCDDALQQTAEAFETEWEIVGKVIHLRKIEYNKDSPLVLKSGKGLGLEPETGRLNSSESKQLEILHVQGGDKNIDPSRYGGRELLLPKSQVYTYNNRRYRTSADGLSVSRDDKPLVTHAEGALDLTHIYPKRIGTVSAVETTAKGFCDFKDSSIPEEINYANQLIAGETMTVIFQTGMLAGKEFEVKYSSHLFRQFQVIEQEIDGITMPRGAFMPRVGDKYVVYNTTLPEAYICNNATQTGASWEMLKEAVKYLHDNEGALFTYSATLDGMYTKDKWLEIGGNIRLGGYVSLSDDDYLPTPELVRIISVRDYPNNPHKPKIELSNGVVGGTVRSELEQLGNTEVDIERYYGESVKYTKRRWRDAAESLGMIEGLMGSFNEDIGELRDEIGDIQFTPPITPITIQTMALLIGDPSLQYIASSLNVTYDVQTKVLKMTASFITHQTLGKAKVLKAGAISGGKGWGSSSFTSPPLTDTSKAYYLYLRASKTSTSAIGFLSEKPQSFAGDADAYNLLVGILSSEYDGERSFAKLYGFMEILPGRITADEMIIQADRTTIADAAGNKVAIFSGVGGGLVEMKHVSIDGFFKQRYTPVEYGTGDNFVPLDLSYNLLFTPRSGITYPNAPLLELPYSDKFNGVTFKMAVVCPPTTDVGFWLIVNTAAGGSDDLYDSPQRFYHTSPIFVPDKTLLSSAFGNEWIIMFAGAPAGSLVYLELHQVTKDIIIVSKVAATSKTADPFPIDN